jgi:hypothetical protein
MFKFSGLPGHSTGEISRVTTNANGEPFPTIIELRTDSPVSPPPNNLKIVPENLRVEWDFKQRSEYIAEWYDKGFPIPEGGWSNYDIYILSQGNIEEQILLKTLFP